MSRLFTGDGDRCPQGCAPGAMWVLPSKNQYCPNSAHRGGYLYQYDGVTPVAAPRPAPEPGQGRTTASQEQLGAPAAPSTGQVSEGMGAP